jgi:glutamate-5-semialdehyde dehydrogenase
LSRNATCPVIVSGRGNNFVYVNKEADLDKALFHHQWQNVKYFGLQCLDKVLIDTNLENWEAFAQSSN